jgi:hypothetical protein
LYLKEVQRVVILYLAGTPDMGLNKPYIQKNSMGIPLIIPGALRTILKREVRDTKVIRALMSLISIYRVFHVDVRPSLTTITSPFDGISKVLDVELIRASLKDLSISTLKLKTISHLVLESASPNAPKSTFGAPLDLLAYCKDINYSLRLIKYLLYHKEYLFSLYLISLLLFAYPLSFFIDGDYHLGKLSVVYDQAGKARVIAITNYFTQVALKPLHDSIFSELGLLPEDGTFDQEKPLRKLVATQSNEKFHCFDLSAATDRLPIDLQVQILNLLNPGLGDH